MTDETRKLTPANENPWYVLMTLYGEQEGDEIDWDLHDQNRKVWNAWSCQDLDDDERAKVAASSGIDIAETQGWDDIAAGVQERHKAEMLARNGDDFEYRGFPDKQSIIKLSEIAFSNTVVLEKAIFTQATRFNRATFTHAADFSGATFTHAADFSGATFTHAADFSGATFTQDADFSGATFTQDADFSGATFTHAAYFGNATFTHAAYFGNATFTQVAFFRDVRFTQATRFNRATFTQNAYFSGATFTQNAYFSGATFTQNAYFSGATFTQDVYFSGATFEGAAKFIDAKFGFREGSKICVPDFTEAAFAKVVSFREAHFATHYPVLEGTQFREALVVTAKPAHWPDQQQQLLDVVDPKKGYAPTKEVAKESCASLRHELAKQGMPEEEHFFFRREMHFASQIDGWWQRLPYRLFGVFSNYGESIAKPTRALGELYVIGAGAFFGHFLATKGLLSAVTLSLSLSFSNLLPLFGFGRTFLKDALFGLPPYLQVISAAQTVLALPLLFFLGLGLRKRFRLR